MRNKFVVWFEEVDKHDVGLVGGKGANLGEMSRAGFPVPYGFILTSYAYFYFLEKQKIRKHIERILSTLDHRRPELLHDVAHTIREIIIKTPVPHDISEMIVEHYEQLYEHEQKYRHIAHKLVARLKSAYDPPLVAVRSSATAEDLPDASFAGQQETYLNIKGETNLVHSIRDCWASLFTERAIFYRAEKGFDHFKVGLAAVIQRMVQSSTSGVMFTVDPVTGNKNHLIIEAVYGLGEYIVQGKVTPDQYIIDKKTMQTVRTSVGLQDAMLTRVGTKNKEVKLNKKKGSQQKLTSVQIEEVARLGRQIEKHYYFPQDIEWAFENGRIFITQSRPITTLSNKRENEQVLIKQEVYLTGDAASPGISSGTVVIIHHAREIGKIKEGDILVASATNPDFVPAMKRSCAILTEHGGRTSHAAIVSRELGVPCIVGIAGLLSKVKDGDVLTVNGSLGQVFKGKVEIAHIAEKHHAYKTRTKIYLNLGESEKAHELAQLPFDGVGLLRAEFMIANIGEHPKALLAQKKGHLLTNKLAHDLAIICKAFYPRPVVYRTTDFKTNEYRHLKGGAHYEPEESNPMLGYRGVYRYINEPDVFALEINAIKKVRHEGLTNLHLMFPFVRSPEHLRASKVLVEKQGLVFSDKFKLWMMVELPVNVILLEDFLKEGVQGVSVGSNDLTMLLLGTDRDNETVASIFNERNKAVYWALKKTIQTCHNFNVTSSICGQSVSDYEEILELVVKNGITSVSINPDALWRVNQSVYHLEHGK